MIDLDAGSAIATASGLEDMTALKAATEAVETVEAPTDVPSHRSHDPAKSLKRSDPFQFGSRYLEAGDDVFEFNAWDHVETDDAYKVYTEEQLEKQRQSPVSDFDKSEFYLVPTLAFQFGIMMIPIPMHSSSEFSDENLTFNILSLPSDLPSILLLYFHTLYLVCITNTCIKTGSTQIRPCGGTSSIKTTRPISSKTASGYSRSFPYWQI